MNDNSKVTISHLHTEELQQITVKINWYNKHFDIAIVNGHNSLTGTMTEIMAGEFSEQLGITIDDYIKKCKVALSENGGPNSFIYKIVDNYIFQWKKVEDQIKIIFGSVHLTAAPVVDTLHDIINATVTNNFQLKENMLRLQREKQLLENDNKELLQRIDEYMNIKMRIESELYNQFLLVLNTKKKRIVRLEKLLKSNNIEVSRIFEVNEEDEDRNTRQDLYDCETELESNSDDDTEEESDKQTPGSSGTSLIKQKTKHSNMFDSDSEEMCVIPKRNCKKSSQNTTIGDGIDKEKAGCSGMSNKKNEPERSKICDLKLEETCIIPKHKTNKSTQNIDDLPEKEINVPSNKKISVESSCSKRSSNKRNKSTKEIDCSDEEPVPCKSRVVKANETNKSENFNIPSNSEVKKVKFVEKEKNEEISNSTKNTTNSNTFRDDNSLFKPNSSLCTITKVESSVDDILAGLIA